MDINLQYIHTEIIVMLRGFEAETLNFLKQNELMSDEEIEYFSSKIDASRRLLTPYKDGIVNHYKKTPDAYAALVGLSRIRSLLSLASVQTGVGIPFSPDRVAKGRRKKCQ